MDRALVAMLVVVGAGVVAVLLRTRRAHAIERVEPADFGLAGVGASVAGFSSPMCHACQQWQDRLAAEHVPATWIDVKERPDLARRYRVSVTPTVLLVEGDGRVLRQFGGDPDAAALATVRRAMLAPR